MRPELARTILAMAAAALSTLPPPSIDVEDRLWRLYEQLFQREYRDERECSHLIDLGGEG